MASEPLSPSEQNYRKARATALRVRSRFIELTYELPKDPSPDVLRLWNVADIALLDFVRALDRAEGSTRESTRQ